MVPEKDSGLKSWLRWRSGLAFLGFAAIALFFLWEEDKAHILGVLPYASFLLCTLMHLFHGGHGGQGAGIRTEKVMS